MCWSLSQSRIIFLDFFYSMYPFNFWLVHWYWPHTLPYVTFIALLTFRHYLVSHFAILQFSLLKFWFRASYFIFLYLIQYIAQLSCIISWMHILLYCIICWTDLKPCEHRHLLYNILRKWLYLTLKMQKNYLNLNGKSRWTQYLVICNPLYFNKSQKSNQETATFFW